MSSFAIDVARRFCNGDEREGDTIETVKRRMKNRMEGKNVELLA